MSAAILQTGDTRLLIAVPPFPKERPRNATGPATSHTSPVSPLRQGGSTRQWEKAFTEMFQGFESANTRWQEVSLPAVTALKPT